MSEGALRGLRWSLSEDTKKPLFCRERFRLQGVLSAVNGDRVIRGEGESQGNEEGPFMTTGARGGTWSGEGSP